MHKSTSYTSSAVSSSATTLGPTSGPAERRGSLGSAVITTATPASVQGTGSGHGKGHGFGQPSMAHQQASSGLNARVVSIAAGFSHSIAVTSAGAVFTWGCGTFGRLGHGSHCDEYLPKQVRYYGSEVQCTHHCTAIYCTALALHCTALHFTSLYCTALHCTVYNHSLT